MLKGSESVRPSTRDRVNSAIRDLGYVYNRGAANLRRAHSNMVGMIIHDLINPFCAELAVGIERSFHAAGYVPFIANTAGWYTAELGRQPWVVYELLRTAHASSENVSSGNALFSLLGFMGLYALLSILCVLLFARILASAPWVPHEAAPHAPEGAH